MRIGMLVLLSSLAAPAWADGPPLRFDRVVIDADFPGGYQVEVVDVDGDRRPDVVALGGSTLAWYRNPTWTKRVITSGIQTPGIISSATADLDGDGRAEVAIAYEFAMNAPARGRLGFATQGKTIDDPWTFREVGPVPSIHRLRWADFDRDGRRDLVVAPIFGPAANPPDFAGQGANLLVHRGFHLRSGRRTSESLGSFPILHAVDVVDLFKDGRSWLLTASDAGVARIGWGREYKAETSDRWLLDRVFTVPNRSAPATKRGASEVHFGRLADGRALLARIEPWHGNRVVVSTAAIKNRPEIGPYLDPFGPDTVIDDTLDDGHALWVADVDGDGSDEVFAGHRGKDALVSAYRFDGKSWTRTVIDPDLAAQDLRGGDIDGDGTPDIVAIGGKTHNIVWFRPIRSPR